MTEEMIEVYHITNIDNVPNIIEHGLKIEYSLSGKNATLFNNYSFLIQKELKEKEPNRIIIYRNKILYARIFENEKTIKKLKENVQGAAMILFNVNSNDVYIGDDAIISGAVFAHVDYIETGKDIYERKLFEFLYEYWNGVLLLSRYINEKLEFEWPEVLIPFDIPPEKIGVIRI